jgi:predicted phage tail protein
MAVTYEEALWLKRLRNDMMKHYKSVGEYTDEQLLEAVNNMPTKSFREVVHYRYERNMKLIDISSITQRQDGITNKPLSAATIADRCRQAMSEIAGLLKTTSQCAPDDRPIQTLGVNPRLRNTLLSNGISTVRDVQRAGYDELAKMYGVGIGSLDELCKKMAEIGKPVPGFREMSSVSVDYKNCVIAMRNLQSYGNKIRTGVIDQAVIDADEEFFEAAQKLHETIKGKKWEQEFLRKVGQK